MKDKFFSKRRNILFTSSVFMLTILSMVLLIAPGMAISAETGDVCVGHYQPGAVCTANDVRIVSFTPVQGTFSGCTNGIATGTFDVLLSAVGSPDRYDIGLFFDQDGTSALTGTNCFHDFLDGVQSASRPTADNDADGILDTNGTASSPYWNGDGDVCSDLPTNTDAHRTVTLTFKCADLNGDGQIDIPTCASWDNNSTPNCNGVTGAFPSTKSKCNCQVVPSGILLPPQTPAILVQKSVNPTTTTPGGSATFTVTARNTGSVPLVNVDVTDDDCTLSGPTGDGGTPDVLDVNETWTYTCTVNDLQPPSFTNHVTITGHTEAGAPVSGSASATVAVQAPLAVTDVPTMNEWGMIIFMALAGLGSVYYLRRLRGRRE